MFVCYYYERLLIDNIVRPWYIHTDNNITILDFSDISLPPTPSSFLTPPLRHVTPPAAISPSPRLPPTLMPSYYHFSPLSCFRCLLFRRLPAHYAAAMSLRHVCCVAVQLPRQESRPRLISVTIISFDDAAMAD